MKLLLSLLIAAFALPSFAGYKIRIKMQAPPDQAVVEKIFEIGEDPLTVVLNYPSGLSYCQVGVNGKDPGAWLEMWVKDNKIYSGTYFPVFGWADMSEKISADAGSDSKLFL